MSVGAINTKTDVPFRHVGAGHPSRQRNCAQIDALEWDRGLLDLSMHESTVVIRLAILRSTLGSMASLSALAGG